MFKEDINLDGYEDIYSGEEKEKVKKSILVAIGVLVATGTILWLLVAPAIPNMELKDTALLRAGKGLILLGTGLLILIIIISGIHARITGRWVLIGKKLKESVAGESLGNGAVFMDRENVIKTAVQKYRRSKEAGKEYTVAEAVAYAMELHETGYTLTEEEVEGLERDVQDKL